MQFHERIRISIIFTVAAGSLVGMAIVYPFMDGTVATAVWTHVLEYPDWLLTSGTFILLAGVFIFIALKVDPL